MYCRGDTLVASGLGRCGWLKVNLICLIWPTSTVGELLLCSEELILWIHRQTTVWVLVWVYVWAWVWELCGCGCLGVCLVCVHVRTHDMWCVWVTLCHWPNTFTYTRDYPNTKIGTKPQAIFTHYTMQKPFVWRGTERACVYTIAPINFTETQP